MKQQLFNNILLSCCLVCALYSYDQFGTIKIHLIHYVAVAFFATLSFLQIILLSRYKNSPQFFVLVFNLSATLKMGLSIVFLIIYYLALSNNTTNQDKIFFSIFFSVSYIAFLTLNIWKGIKNEKK